MAIIKQTELHKGEILENGEFQVCYKVSYIEDGTILSYKLFRHIITPLDDYSNEVSEVKSICESLFTEEAKIDYQLFIDNSEA